MFKPMIRFCLVISVLVSIGSSVQAQQITPTPLPPGPTLNSILSRGLVNCGVNSELPGFGYLDPNTGLVSGFDVDFCRALGAAVFGDVTAAATPLYNGDDGLAGVLSGDIDVLFHNVTWRLGASLPGLEFGPANFYNGQTFMVRIESAIDDWQALDERTVCVTAGTPAETHLPAAMQNRNLDYQLVTLGTLEEARDALTDGRCDAQSADRVALEVLRQSSPDPEAFQIWTGHDHTYTSEPFAPVYRSGDQQWAEIVKWVVLGLIKAEELGVDSETVAELAQADGEAPAAYIQRVGPSIAGLLNTSTGAPANNLGLPPNFMEMVVREVGNYGEIYDRNLVSGTGQLNLERDMNQLWRDGGLFFTPDWG